MHDIKRKDEWMKELKFELDRYFRSEEVTEILSYYEEMIDDRMENGEDIVSILNDYDAKSIAKSMIPNVISRRTGKDEKMTSNLWMIVLVLFSTPILIPLGVVYLSIMISVFSVLISGVAVMLSGFGVVIIQVIGGFSTGLALPEFMVTIGIALLALVICLLIGYVMVKASWWLLEHMAIWFSRLIVRKKDLYESH